MYQLNETEKTILLRVTAFVMIIVAILLFGVILIPFAFFNGEELRSYFVQKEAPESATVTPMASAASVSPAYWAPPALASITDAEKKAQVEYGKELVAHTSKYLGPKGSVLQISNGMNCQNCHLNAGTKVLGNNYGSVASTYPKFRARSGTEENIFKRVNDCFERSLNGKSLDTTGKEMQAIVAYIEFLGSNVAKGSKAEGSGLGELPFLDRAADPALGQLVYTAQCQSCHQADGQGTMGPDGTEYLYPPLWGDHAYNDAAGLYRLSNFAKYIKYNMPFGVNHENTILTDEEAWDLAAYVNSQPRPHKNTPKDWPDVSKKPIDHPFGPYADKFSERQHKFGPFGPIKDATKR